MELPKIDNTNLWDKTYLILKDRIIHRQFKPNQKLSLPDLALQLGVSRTPIRDALNRLEMDGLVKTVAKVGTFVNAINTEDVLDIIDTRLMLELWVVQKLSALSPEDLKEKTDKLEAILDQASQMIDQQQLSVFLKSDFNLQFHLEFMKLGDNKRNVEIYLAMMNYHSLAAENSLFTKEMVCSAISQHRQIVAALRSGDYDQISHFIKLHLDDSKQRLIRRILESGGEL